MPFKQRRAHLAMALTAGLIGSSSLLPHGVESDSQTRRQPRSDRESRCLVAMLAKARASSSSSR